ncbi:hypothetical protein JCM17846_15850 [Iodidimonas nitroreducens]|uniref:Uncharacterized protein n=1 Tax=Iodidimonas nitroreducens TaxID=1236968 RepID=A0A5A7N6F2_9PROT|nr:hypothetical protein JCM17846_15850 [Iodidimonas nitroreducens]
MNQPAPLSHTLDELEQIVRDAGALALGYFGTPVRAWEKNPNDPVSEADLAVNDLLHERLQIDHETGWLSEESRDDPNASRKPRHGSLIPSMAPARFCGVIHPLQFQWLWSKMADRFWGPFIALLLMKCISPKQAAGPA